MKLAHTDYHLEALLTNFNLTLQVGINLNPNHNNFNTKFTLNTEGRFKLSSFKMRTFEYPVSGQATSSSVRSTSKYKSISTYIISTK